MKIKAWAIHDARDGTVLYFADLQDFIAALADLDDAGREADLTVSTVLVKRHEWGKLKEVSLD